MMRTRFAPSPTGDLHVGGAYVALASWLLARRAPGGGGVFVVRVEDLDLPRVALGSEARILDDLAWLGLASDEGPRVGGPFGPYAQSQRFDRYAQLVDGLRASGLVYPCDCSRAEIARGLSAPHAGEEAVYPGNCRDREHARAPRRPFSQRLRLEDETFTFDDLAAGRVSQNLLRDAGDFVLRRGDGLFTYQLAVAADDLDMRISDVVRGSDLLASTPRQLYLMKLFVESGLAPGAAAPPRYTHVPLVVDAAGERLAKRTRGARVRALREAGVAAAEIVGVLAHALGLAPDASPRSAAELAAGPPIDAARVRWPTSPWHLPARWAALAEP